MENKKASLTINKLIIIILVLVVILVVIIFIFKPQMWDWIRNLPGYSYDTQDRDIEIKGDDKIVNFCTIKIAKIIGNKGEDAIKFCGNEECSDENLINSKLYWKGVSAIDAEIRVTQSDIDDKIGEVRGRVITIFPEIFKGAGIYEEVRKDLPEYDALINLDGAYYYPENLICRTKRVETKVLLDKSELDTKAYSIEDLKKSHSEFKNFIENKELIESVWMKIGYSLNNENSRLGFDTGRNGITEMKFKKVGEDIYIKLRDNDFLSPDESPWVLLDYWNSERNFVLVPFKFILSENGK